MPTDTTDAEATEKAPPGPSLDDVRAVIREEIADYFAGTFGLGPKGEAEPVKLPQTERELEAYTEEVTRRAMSMLAADEEKRGKVTPSPEPDPEPEPEVEPEGPARWADKVRRWLWES